MAEMMLKLDDDAIQVFTKAFVSLRKRIEKLESIFDIDAVDDMPVCTDDHFIKLTGYNHEPLYVKMDCITRMRWIDDIDPYTRIYSAGGDFSVRETPEQIMESLGYRKEQNDA